MGKDTLIGYVVAAIIALIGTAYLFAALLFPERF